MFDHDESTGSLCRGARSVSACVSSSESIDRETLHDRENQREHGGKMHAETPPSAHKSFIIALLVNFVTIFGFSRPELKILILLTLITCDISVAAS